MTDRPNGDQAAQTDERPAEIRAVRGPSIGRRPRSQASVAVLLTVLRQRSRSGQAGYTRTLPDRELARAARACPAALRVARNPSMPRSTQVADPSILHPLMPTA